MIDYPKPEPTSRSILPVEGTENDGHATDQKAANLPAKPKEGGIAGWATVFGAFWGLFATFGQLNAFGSYQAYYIQHQLSHYSPSDVSWIGSIQLWVFFFSVRRDSACDPGLWSADRLTGCFHR
jgi:hypothetical protein